MKISHTPLEPSARIGWQRPSQPLKSPTTLTRWAFGAQTAKCTPSEAPIRIGMGAELLVNAGVIALAEKIQIEIADDAAEPEGVVEFGDLAARVDDPQTIVRNLVQPFEPRLEHAGRMPALHRDRDSAPVRDHVNPLRARQDRAHHDAGDR